MRIRIGLLVASLFCFTPAQAQTSYPTKPIRVMIGSGAGGLADVTTRLVGQKLTDRLGQPVVVENRPSAGGILATQAVATAAPDGHTLMVMVTGNAASKSLLKTLPYDLEKDFAPITSVAFFDLLVLVVSPVDVTRAALAPTPTADLAGRLWRLERRADLVELRRHGLRVIEWRYPEPLEAALADSRRRRVRLAETG